MGSPPEASSKACMVFICHKPLQIHGTGALTAVGFCFCFSFSVGSWYLLCPGIEFELCRAACPLPASEDASRDS